MNCIFKTFVLALFLVYSISAKSQENSMEQKALVEFTRFLFEKKLPDVPSDFFDKEEFNGLIALLENENVLYSNMMVCMVSDAIDRPLDSSVGISAMNANKQLEHRKNLENQGFSPFVLGPVERVEKLTFDKFIKCNEKSFFIVVRHHLYGVDESVVEFNLIHRKTIDDPFYYTFQMVFDENDKLSNVMMYIKVEYDYTIDCK